jgi:FkbM family methyltransferase
VTTVLPERVRYAGSTADVIQRAVFVYGIWEPDITTWMRSFVRSGDTVIDIGANTGYYATLLGAIVGPTGTVMAFEPVPSIYRELIANLARNHLKNVEAHQVALGSAQGEIEVFRASSTNIGNSSTRWEQGHTSEGAVEVRVADDVLAAVGARIRLVKIDTEGDEIEVLRGMGRTLSSMPPGSAVLVEVTPDKLRLRSRAARELWDMFTVSQWAPHVIRNDYDFERYDERPRAVCLKPVTQLPQSRADMVFIRRSPSS